MEDKTYLVYVKTLENGYISAVNSSAFLIDIDGWINVDEGSGDKYYHAQGNYFPKPIYTELGAYRYKFVNGVVQELSEAEIAEQEAVIIAAITPPQSMEARVAELEEALAMLLSGVIE